MQISPTTATAPTYPLGQQPAATQQNAKAQQDAKTQETAAEQAKRDAEKKVFTPAPPIRPNIQDYVDINRTLIALRKI